MQNVLGLNNDTLGSFIRVEVPFYILDASNVIALFNFPVDLLDFGLGLGLGETCRGLPFLGDLIAIESKFLN